MGTINSTFNHTLLISWPPLIPFDSCGSFWLQDWDCGEPEQKKWQHDAAWNCGRLTDLSSNHCTGSSLLHTQDTRGSHAGMVWMGFRFDSTVGTRRRTRLRLTLKQPQSRCWLWQLTSVNGLSLQLCQTWWMKACYILLHLSWRLNSSEPFYWRTPWKFKAAEDLKMAGNAFWLLARATACWGAKSFQWSTIKAGETHWFL